MSDEIVEEVKASLRPIPPIEQLTEVDVVSKVYDATGQAPGITARWLGDLPGVVDMDELRDQLPPGDYTVVIRARQGNALGRKAGTILVHNTPLHVDGERDENTHISVTPTIGASPALGSPQEERPADRSHVPITDQDSARADEQSAISGLVDLVRESRQPQSGISDQILDALTFVERVQALTVTKSGEPTDGAGHELVKKRLTAMFDEGLGLGKKIGEATADSNVSSGDGEGSGIFSILERVLAHPTIKDALARASAPVVSLDELTATLPQNGEDTDG